MGVNTRLNWSLDTDLQLQEAALRLSVAIRSASTLGVTRTNDAGDLIDKTAQNV